MDRNIVQAIDKAVVIVGEVAMHAIKLFHLEATKKVSLMQGL